MPQILWVPVQNRVTLVLLAYTLVLPEQFLFILLLCGYGNLPYSVANGSFINLIHFGFPLGILSSIRQIRGPAVCETLLYFLFYIPTFLILTLGFLC